MEKEDLLHIVMWKFVETALTFYQLFSLPLPPHFLIL